MLQQLLSQQFESFEGPAHLLPWRKVNEQHISKMLDLESDESKRAHERYKFSLLAWGIAFALILAFLAFLVFRLADSNAELLKDIIGKFLAFAGGFGAGAVAAPYLRKKGKGGEE